MRGEPGRGEMTDDLAEHRQTEQQPVPEML
jgi:hypothetical protein